MSKVVITFLFVTCLSPVLSLPAAATSQPSKSTTPSCGQVKNWFLEHNVAAAEEQIPLTFISGASLAVCEASDTCCTASMEEELRGAASRDLRVALRAASENIRGAFADTAAAIQSQIQLHIKASMTKTETMFTELYRKVSLLAKEPLTVLFGKLERFMLGKEDTEMDVDVSAAVSTFFEDLYSRMYRHSPAFLPGRAVIRDLSDEYMDCIRNAQADLRPFSEIPRRLATSLARSLEAVRALLSSLQLGVEVLNATDHTHLSKECSSALLRSTYCSQCRGYSALKPCRGLCTNVLRGCLATLADVDQPWNEWLDATEKLAGVIVNGTLGAHDILASIDSRLSEAVYYALENGPVLEKKVKRICGETNATLPKEGALPDVPAAGPDQDSEDQLKDLSAIHDDISSGDLRWRLEALLPALAGARGFFANVADAICGHKENPFAGHDDADCWNGHKPAEYTKPISGIGIGAQKYNAEVRVAPSDVDSDFAQLSDKLRHVRQVLASKTVVSPEPDSLVMADFASGSGDGASSNGNDWSKGDLEPDEDTHGSFPDDDGASGSGDGIDEDDSVERKNKPTGGIDIEIVDETTPRSTTAPPKGSSAQRSAVCSAAAVLSVLVSLYLRHLL